MNINLNGLTNSIKMIRINEEPRGSSTIKQYEHGKFAVNLGSGGSGGNRIHLATIEYSNIYVYLWEDKHESQYKLIRNIIQHKNRDKVNKIIFRIFRRHLTMEAFEEMIEYEKRASERKGKEEVQKEIKKSLGINDDTYYYEDGYA